MMNKKTKILVISLIAVVVLVAGYIIYVNLITPDDEVVAYKPNIYLYPEEETGLSVELSFPKGGKILKSIPSYKSKWKVKVKPNGKIDNKFPFLFYESSQPNEWQQESGWLVNRDSLEDFFEHNMQAYGFNSTEIYHFTSYWVPRLDKSKFYLVYPQENKEIDPLIRLETSIKAQHILRLHYFIKEASENSHVKKHKIPQKIERKGFFICEWGVLLEK